MKWLAVAATVVLGQISPRLLPNPLPDPGGSSRPHKYVVNEADVKPSSRGPLRIRVLQEGKSPEPFAVAMLTTTGTSLLNAKPHSSNEVVYVLDGAVQLPPLQGSERTTWIQAGDAAFFPAGRSTPYRLVAKEQKPARALVFYARSGPEKSLAAALDDEDELVFVKPIAEPPRVARGRALTELSIAGGKGSVQLLFEATNAPTKAAALTRMTLKPEAAVPEHVHAGESEILYVISGKGELNVAGQVFSVGPGSSISIPPNTPHAFKVTSESAVEAVQIYTPHGPEQRFKASAPSR